MTSLLSGLAEALDRLDRLVSTAADRGIRRPMLGIVGEPGAGKSTVSEALLAHRPDAAFVPMDGFHLADETLDRLGRHERKGAPDTFDVDGYVSALDRIRRGEHVYVPRFDRALEAAIAGAVPVPATAPLVITEGNYLLLDEGGWERVSPLLDEIWFVDVDGDVRRRRLVERHIEFGRDAASAQTWVERVDEPNARRIAASRNRADALLRIAADHHLKGNS